MNVVNPLISVVVPVYKSDDCLDELYRRLSLSLKTITENYEIILVEDCGGGRSWEIIEALAKCDGKIKGIQFSRNFGQHYGITAGLDFSRGDWVVVMDCDLQDRPEEIPLLYSKALEGYDVVVAKRANRQDSFLKKVTSKFFYKIFSYLSDIKYDAEVGNFRIISRKVVNGFCSMRENLRFFGGLIHWLGYPTASIEICHDARFSGRSTYTFRKLWLLASESIIAYSDKPLRISIHIGFFISLISFGYGSVILYHSVMYGSALMGWSSLIVSLYFLGGIIISILGVLGVYLGKAFDETKRRPLYIVSRTTF